MCGDLLVLQSWNVVYYKRVRVIAIALLTFIFLVSLLHLSLAIPTTPRRLSMKECGSWTEKVPHPSLRL